MLKNLKSRREIIALMSMEDSKLNSIELKSRHLIRQVSIVLLLKYKRQFTASLPQSHKS